MRDLQVCVLQVPGGWSLECQVSGLVLMFLSAAKAEAKAHDLGRRLAVLGHETRVSIRDERKVPMVTALYFAD